MNKLKKWKLTKSFKGSPTEKYLARKCKVLPDNRIEFEGRIFDSKAWDRYVTSMMLSGFASKPFK